MAYITSAVTYVSGSGLTVPKPAWLSISRSRLESLHYEKATEAAWMTHWKIYA